MQNLGNRIKTYYEDRYRIYLTRRTPVIIRLDGKAFHTLTRKFEKPFCIKFIDSMTETAITLCKNIQNVQCAYVQSDEISLFLKDYSELTTEAWFDYNVQKMASVSAAIATSVFKDSMNIKNLVSFDSRVFNIPKEEVCNYFIWRQKDWVRNSVNMLAQSNFSHKELQGKSISKVHDMLHTKNINWADLEPCLEWDFCS